jgi:hypothetical protein
MRFIAGLLAPPVLLAIAGAAFVYSGAYDVAVSSPHSKLERQILNAAMMHSVTARADTVEAPPTSPTLFLVDGSSIWLDGVIDAVAIWLLAIDFANDRHPFFDLGQHAQIGGALVRRI